jgi:hypothetical protein
MSWFRPKVTAEKDRTPELAARITDLELRCTKLERDLSGAFEYMENRIDRGNQVWRQIRARERREEIDAEDEGESDPRQGVLPLDEGGSGEERLRPLSADLEPGTPEPPYVEAARLIAEQIRGNTFL